MYFYTPNTVCCSKTTHDVSFVSLDEGSFVHLVRAQVRRLESLYGLVKSTLKYSPLALFYWVNKIKGLTF